MASRAVGATLAAVAIFTVLIISDYTLVAGEQERLVSYSVAAEETGLYSQAKASEASAVIDYILRAERILGSEVWPCTDTLSSISRAISGSSLALHSGAVAVQLSSSVWNGSGTGQSETILSPFSGFLPGLLNILIVTDTHAVGAGGRISFSLSRAVSVHIPARVEALSSFCLRALEIVSSSVHSAVELGKGCNTTRVAEALDSARREAYFAASNFSFSLFYSFGSQCSLRYEVSVAQSVTQEPAGGFSLRLGESVSVSLLPADQHS